MRNVLKNSKRIVVKAGTSILTDSKGMFSPQSLKRLGAEIVQCIQKKREMVLVSSGAIAFGMESCGLEKRPKEMSQLQACAAIGQGKLMHVYENFFSKEGIHTAQLLLTRDILENRKRFLLARQTFEALLAMKNSKKETVLPIVNENDTVATEEIAFGDNDTLGVQVAHLIKADLLIILSDVDGFYLKDGSRVREVSSEKEIDVELVKHLKDSVKQKTVGGMRAKLSAAKTAMRLNMPLLIVSGHEEGILSKALGGNDVGTLFLPGGHSQGARREWIAFSAARKGIMTIDQGACEALQSQKKSLLPGGIIEFKGSFQKGDVVELATCDGRVFGRGKVRLGSVQLSKVIGKKSSEMKVLLGNDISPEIIHRNDLVIWS